MCVPAHNEESTITDVVRLVREAGRLSAVPLHEIIVVDDRSTDRTAMLASRAGARVLSTVEECAEFGAPAGKGDALWTALRHCKTEFVTFVDGDVTELHPRFLARLNIPLHADNSVHLVKGRFCRGQGRNVSGRVTMLTARPLLALLRPELQRLHEPLGGMFAGRTDTLGQLWLDCDYGVDVGILLDVAEAYGPDSVLEVDLGSLRHRNRDLSSLTHTAEQVARAILVRAGESSLMGRDLVSRRPPPRRLRLPEHADRES